LRAQTTFSETAASLRLGAQTRAAVRAASMDRCTILAFSSRIKKIDSGKALFLRYWHPRTVLVWGQQLSSSLLPKKHD
jgi:hypothetical protein